MSKRNPYNFTKPVSDPSMFFGRWHLVETLLARLTDYQTGAFAIYGGRRAGKTSLMRILENKLTERLDEGIDPIVVPLYLDLHLDPPTSSKDFFQRMVYRMNEWQETGLGIAEPLPNIEENAPAQSFANTFRTLYRRAVPKLGGVKIVLLIDETEKLQRPEWTSDLDDELRSLLSNMPGVSGNMGLVMTGGTSFFKELIAPHFGSPLRNVMEEEINLEACSANEMMSLIQSPTENQIPEDVAGEIIKQAGGHLFLGQFLMKHLWDAGVENATISLVKEIAESFPDRRRDFETWHTSMGDIGSYAYAALENEERFYSISAVATRLKSKPIDVTNALRSLVFHSLAIQKGRTYKKLGKMFNDWFDEQILPTLSLDSPNIARPIDEQLFLNEMKDAFNLDEIKKLCFKMDIEFENISGTTLESKIIELILFARRSHISYELLKMCKEMRPNRGWKVFE